MAVEQLQQLVDSMRQPDHPWMVRQTQGGAANLLLSDDELIWVKSGLLTEIRRRLMPQPPLYGTKGYAIAYRSPTAPGCWNSRGGQRGALSNWPLVCPFGEPGQLMESRGIVLPLRSVGIVWDGGWVWRLRLAAIEGKGS